MQNKQQKPCKQTSKQASKQTNKTHTHTHILTHTYTKHTHTHTHTHTHKKKGGTTARKQTGTQTVNNIIINKYERANSAQQRSTILNKSYKILKILINILTNNKAY